MRILGFLTLMTLSVNGSCQFYDDFSNDLYNWSGDTALFQINDNEELQLDNQGSGDVRIWQSVESMDSAFWQGEILLDFSPSNSNRLEIWCISQGPELEDGLVLQIGESGEDSLRVIEVQDGLESPIGALGLPSFLKDVVEFQFQLKCDASSSTLMISYDNESSSLSWQKSYAGSSKFDFLIRCQHTSTRADKFYFDKLAVGQLPIDTIPPQLEKVEIIDSSQIQFYFSEELDSLNDPKINFIPYLNVNEIIQLPHLGVWRLILDDGMKSGTAYSFSIEAVMDLAGNYSQVIRGEIQYVEVEPIAPFDILITEVLPDPTPAKALPECEFVEIYNTTNHFFSLSDLLLADASSQVFLPDSLMYPGERIILCDLSCEGAFKPFGRVVGVENFPNFNNDGDDVILVDFIGRIIHKISFTKDWYGDRKRSEGGFSLEMKFIEDLCLGSSNWHAAEESQCGTPGKVNSVSNETYQPKPIQCLQIDASSDYKIDFSFDRQLSQIQDLLILKLDEEVIPKQIKISDSEMQVLLPELLSIGQPYKIQMLQLKDCRGEVINSPLEYEVFVPRPADSGEVVINEVLFNPRSGEKDFFEIVNTSKDYLKIDRLCLEVRTEVDTNYECVIGPFILAPGQPMAFTEDTLLLSSSYACGDMAPMKLPTLPDDRAELRLFEFNFAWQKTLDESTYNEDWHSPVLLSREGVSLEKRASQFNGGDPMTWQSASTAVGYATPGLKNSSSATHDSSSQFVSLIDDSFSPNGDGNKDVLEIYIQPDKAGYDLQVSIFDFNGHPIRDLVNRALIGDHYHVVWDGADNDGHLQTIGLYLVLAEMAHPDGDLFRKRIAVVLN